MSSSVAAPSKGKLALFSWGLYDFANTIFSMNVVSLYFALWVTVDNGAEDIFYSLPYSASMLAIAVTSPILGAVSDRYGRRLPFLRIFTILCVFFTALIGRIGGLPLGLLIFAVANFAYQSGLIYYDSLLMVVSNEENRGKISGFGVALGYLGAILGILMVKPFVDAWGRGAAFLPTGVLFMIFAIPCFLFVKEGQALAPWSNQFLREGYTQLRATLQNARPYRHLLRFIAARFLYVDAINTVIAFMSVYAAKAMGFSDSQLQILLITSTTFAVAGSFIYGLVVDRLGPKRTLTLVLAQWVLVFLAAAATFNQTVFYAIGALTGVSLGATWTADRVFLTRLSPPDKLGEFFGLYGMAGRFSAVIGPTIWGVTLWVLRDLGLIRYRIGILVLLTLLGAGFAVLQGVDEKVGVKDIR